MALKAPQIKSNLRKRGSREVSVLLKPWQGDSVLLVKNLKCADASMETIPPLRIYLTDILNSVYKDTGTRTVAISCVAVKKNHVNNCPLNRWPCL